ncbi:MAG TPA: hypothetical protein VGK99_22025 [Acidobacteriota bacterium]|jgi:hypothetical protein
MDLPADWRDFLRILIEQKVHFVLIGGIAVIHHGYPRTTGDLDVFYEPTRGNVIRLRSALDTFLETQFDLTEEELLLPGRIVQLGVPPSRIDLINQIDAVSFAEAWSSAVQVEFEHTGQVPIIGREALIKNKLAVGRNRDKDDLEFLK